VGRAFNRVVEKRLMVATMQHSDLPNPTEGTNENGAQVRSAEPVASQIAAALNEGDHERAGELLRAALEKSPDDNQLLRLAAKQRRQAERFTRVYSLLKETTEAIEADEFVRGVGAYREAVNLCQGFSTLENAAFENGVDEADGLDEKNWRIAKALLEDAGSISPKLVVPESHWKSVRAAEREETIANVLEETALAKPADLGRARERLVRTLEEYPGDLSLANRLKSIESTIEDKRKWDERQKCLKKLTDLRDAMQRETDPAAVAKYTPQAEALAAPHAAEPEFGKIVEDIRHQVISSERAVTALKQDRIEDCLEECAWVLSRMRQHQLFLNIKKKAEERELSLVDEYSNSVSQIKELLAAGKVAEADALCSKASAQLPQFADLQELKQEIAARRSKEDQKAQESADNVRRLLERGERSLREQQYRLAEQSFTSAFKLRPDDKKLSGHLVGLLHGYARSIVRDNPQSAEEVLQLTSRILPGTAVPADLAEAVREKREHAKEEAVRWASLDKITGLNAQVESARKSEELRAVRAELAKNNFSSGNHSDVREAAAALDEKIGSKEVALKERQSRRPVLYRTLAVAATLLLGVGLAYLVGNNHSSSPVAKPKPSEAAIEASASPKAEPNKGAVASPNEVAATAKPAGPVLDVNPVPKPASVEIRGAEINTRIKLDGVLLGKAAPNRTLSKELAAGEHVIELSRNGFVTKMLTRNLAPGENLVLTDRDLQLESTDAATLVASNKRPAKLIEHAAPAPMPGADELQWQSLDKNSPEALRAFVARYPNSSWTGEAKRQMDSALIAREENNDWSAADHNSSTALQDFLKKHPSGSHAASAASTLADLDRKAHAAQTQNTEELAWKKVNAHDEASLVSYLRDYPGGHFHNSAEVALANLRVGRVTANETAAVLTVISRLANAWSAKDLDSILALQRNLSKREVKAELSHVKELAMQISPASPPQIDGLQAIVLCRRQASQTFSDGTRKQIPESIVSYVLSKHDGNWTIEGTK
jgi:hypothetical protein